jgi:hypothetical protein
MTLDKKKQEKLKKVKELQDLHKKHIELMKQGKYMEANELWKKMMGIKIPND